MGECWNWWFVVDGLSPEFQGLYDDLQTLEAW